MSFTNEEFFNDNIVDVNKRVFIILLSSVLVAVSFIVLTAIGLWIVPNRYSIFLAVYSVASSLIVHILNQFPKTQITSMYCGIMASSFFVFLLGKEGYINITVAYAFGPFLSCLYYNRRLTKITTIANFFLILVVFWYRSFTVNSVLSGTESQLNWFIGNVIGTIIEFIFVFLISSSIAKRTNRTLSDFMKSVQEREYAYELLKENNNNINALNKKLEEKNNQLSDTQYKIMEFVSQCLGSHDMFTGHHVVHTQKYVEIICKELVRKGLYTEELTPENIRLFSTAALLHDIGKIHIPEGILNKVGKFTLEEFEMMKSHPSEGVKLLEFLPVIEDGKFNDIAKKMALYHHEKWDGSGYPNGLSGEKIPLCARIMTAADVLDALLSMRLYKEPMSVEEAMNVFEVSKGSHFESCIAQAVLDLRATIELIDKDFKIKEAMINKKELEWWKDYHERFSSLK